MNGIEQHWCPKCQAMTDHMLVKTWKCNVCLGKKLNERKQKGQSSMIPRAPKQLKSTANAVCPCCGASVRLVVEAIV
jgi:rubrerythrin